MLWQVKYTILVTYPSEFLSEIFNFCISDESVNPYTPNRTSITEVFHNISKALT